MNICLGIKTYNRIFYLKQLIDSWNLNKDKNHSWQLIIADDGSNDGTLEYCSHIKDINLISNFGRGLAYQTNTIFKKLCTLDFDLAFIADDDIYFIKPGWDNLYINAIATSGYSHLVFGHKSRFIRRRNSISPLADI